MIDKLRQEALRHGMKLVSNPKVMKLMADPRVMNAITQGYALKGRLQSEFDAHLRTVVGMLNLATKEDLEELQRTLRRVESAMSNLESQAKSGT